jgi:hypothetical protein
MHFAIAMLFTLCFFFFAQRQINFLSLDKQTLTMDPFLLIDICTVFEKLKCILSAVNYYQPYGVFCFICKYVDACFKKGHSIIH